MQQTLGVLQGLLLLAGILMHDKLLMPFHPEVLTSVQASLPRRGGGQVSA
jgi:hypothetical protein